MGSRRPWAKILAVVAALVLLVAASMVYAYLVPWHKKNQRISQLRMAGLTEEQAQSFDDDYGKYAKEDWLSSAYNQTVLDFAEAWAGNVQLAEKSLSTFKTFENALSFMGFANVNGYDGLGFLNEYPRFAWDYQLALPFYSANASLFRTVYNCFLRDPQITLNRNALTLDAFRLYQNLNLVNKNLFLPTIHALDNVTIAYKQLGLPEHDKASLWLLANCTQKSGDIVDFSPIVFKSVDGNHVYL
ncbi:hypothetical protein KEJ33_04090, partial [Candidatus Bathyarchaeota archaeon]|nr:hypothetical protein [Candidatus Bathyarchaeota archaeon]